MKVSPATAAAHAAAIDAIVAAETPAALGTALDVFRDLRAGAAPGTSPGVAFDAEDGHYFNGFHLFTKAGNELAATAVDTLPARTHALWEELGQRHREQAEIRDLVHAAKVDRDGPGQPPIGRPTPVRLPEWLITLLDAEAKAEGISRAGHIRNLIMEARAARRARQTQ